MVGFFSLHAPALCFALLEIYILSVPLKSVRWPSILSFISDLFFVPEFCKMWAYTRVESRREGARMELIAFEADSQDYKLLIFFSSWREEYELFSQIAKAGDPFKNHKSLRLTVKRRGKLIIQMENRTNMQFIENHSSWTPNYSTWLPLLLHSTETHFASNLGIIIIYWIALICGFNYICLA